MFCTARFSFSPFAPCFIFLCTAFSVNSSSSQLISPPGATPLYYSSAATFRILPKSAAKSPFFLLYSFTYNLHLHFCFGVCISESVQKKPENVNVSMINRNQACALSKCTKTRNWSVVQIHREGFQRKPPLVSDSYSAALKQFAERFLPVYVVCGPVSVAMSTAKLSFSVVKCQFRSNPPPTRGFRVEKLWAMYFGLIKLDLEPWNRVQSIHSWHPRSSQNPKDRRGWFNWWLQVRSDMTAVRFCLSD